MKNGGIKNNEALLQGVIKEPFRFSHEVLGELFYLTSLCVERLSGRIDEVPVMVSEKIMNGSLGYTGQHVSIHGEFHSYNNKMGQLCLYVLVKKIDTVRDTEHKIYRNDIFLRGFICKTPIYRETPLGREIADVLLAVNRPCGKSDYIPCICWGNNARYAGSLKVGACVEMKGRIQSREYIKVEGERERIKTAFEVSAGSVRLVKKREFL